MYQVSVRLQHAVKALRLYTQNELMTEVLVEENNKQNTAGLGQNNKPADQSGAHSLAMLLAFHEIRASAQQIAHEYANEAGVINATNMVRAARKNGLKCKAINSSVQKLKKLPLPALAITQEGSWFVLAKTNDDGVLLQHPGKPPEELSIVGLEQLWSGTLVLAARRAGSIASELKFGMRWFLPVLLKYKKLFSEVLLASFFIQCFALISPLFFQVVVDKVLVHRGLTTLDVLIIGLLAIAVFEAILSFLRTYLFSHTTSRVDVQLGAQLFRHLLALPISYFETRATGQTVARVRELENVRDFITSSSLTVVIDLLFTVVFFAVMWVFSPTLTLVVLASVPFYILLSVAITPELRKRVDEKFYRGAINQAFLVESIAGAETLKAMAVEPQMHNRWDENLAAYVKSSFRTISLGAFGSQAVQLINKLVMGIVLWVGTKAVMSGEMTVGQLVAFNMLAGQVSQPVIRLAQLWQDFQQFRISIQRLGDILNTKTEVSTSAPENLPPVQGKVELKNVTFRYRPNEPEILHNVSIEMPAGQTIGVVGRSGSGKSTITKLIQRLYVPETGRVLIDGIDLGLMDPAWLRRQIGVVLQENILFNRSVRDNIALSSPAMPMARIMQAAKLAGAHEFILQLPKGYDTILEERGSNLSGGQRQRIAIARALVTAPRILILDEATAALDYESERIFQQNLARIAQGRTVIIIAHRLSTVRHADTILVMDQGKVIQQGRHDELIRQAGLYQELNKMAQGE
ncbi:Toxin RTX-I translocation ATP-binding protein [Pseudovibrio sp. Ad26]|nr:Toxin RTX-I translocation ATP-binding protein [Pseudovibrio sp. Ad26]